MKLATAIGPRLGRRDAHRSAAAEVIDGSTDNLLDRNEAELDSTDESASPRRHIRWQKILAFAVLPASVVLLAGAAGYLKWVQGSSVTAAAAAAQATTSASESTVAMLTYKPETVAKDLATASEGLTDAFKDSYTSLIRDVVIPGSQQKQISATATVPAAASVSVTENRALVLVFINQTVMIGRDAPSNTASSVKVTLDRVDGRWLISGFDPI